MCLLFIQAWHKFEISNAILYLDPDKSSMKDAETFDIDYLITQLTGLSWRVAYAHF